MDKNEKETILKANEGVFVVECKRVCQKAEHTKDDLQLKLVCAERYD